MVAQKRVKKCEKWLTFMEGVSNVLGTLGFGYGMFGWLFYGLPGYIYIFFFSYTYNTIFWLHVLVFILDLIPSPLQKYWDGAAVSEVVPLNTSCLTFSPPRSRPQ